LVSVFVPEPELWSDLQAVKEPIMMRERKKILIKLVIGINVLLNNIGRNLQVYPFERAL